MYDLLIMINMSKYQFVPGIIRYFVIDLNFVSDKNTNLDNYKFVSSSNKYFEQSVVIRPFLNLQRIEC